MIAKAQEYDQSAKSSDSEKMNNALMLTADKPPIKTPQSYSINQIEVLQYPGAFTFASQNDSDEIRQKLIGLIRNLDSTELTSCAVAREVPLSQFRRAQFYVDGRTSRNPKIGTANYHAVASLLSSR